MTDLKRITPQQLLWLDLETTGLKPQEDKILEVAAIVTDWDFNELGRFESGVWQDAKRVEALLAENPFWISRPEEAKEIAAFAAKGQALSEIEAHLIQLVHTHFALGSPALLAGNSIHMDRRFIRSYWPKLEAHLHYRMLDVSAWKVVMHGKYGVDFPKQEKHRALDDVIESIAELKFYLSRASF